MDKKTIARMVVFVLVWVNTYLAAHHYKTIPVVDDVTVAGWLAFVYSAYAEGKHIYNWIKTNWITKQSAPVAPDPVPTPNAVDVSVPQSPAVTPASTNQNVQQ